MSSYKISQLSSHLIGSEIVKLAGEVNALIAKGEKIYNLTIGDFNPEQFPIPTLLKEEIIKAYEEDQTNYPPGNGVKALRQSISALLKSRAHLDYSEDEILIAGGARPLIYSIFSTLVDPGDSVIFAVPSWNNVHYTYLHRANPIIIHGHAENGFMPTAEDIRPHIQKASLIALCSPQNPTGTVFTEKGLTEICDLILSENKRRGPDEKPVYLLFDQIYWELTFGNTKHAQPVALRPEMKDYTVMVDGLSKSLSATGLRVGWCYGPQFIIHKITSLLSHIGAWAPKAEQVAAARYLSQLDTYGSFLEQQRSKIQQRLVALYEGIQQLKSVGFSVDAISPQAAIYLSAKFALHGKRTAAGKVLETTEDVTDFLLREAKVAVVPFYIFGTERNEPWFRLSVGTLAMEDIHAIMQNLKNALTQLQ